MGLIVYVHSISKDPLWSCRAWKLCPKSCLSKIVKYRTLILNHSCRMSDQVFRREHNIIKITANDVSRRVLELYLFSRRNWNAWQGSLCHASSKYCLYLLQKCSRFFRGTLTQACSISFALLKTGDLSHLTFVTSFRYFRWICDFTFSNSFTIGEPARNGRFLTNFVILIAQIQYSGSSTWLSLAAVLQTLWSSETCKKCS